MNLNMGSGTNRRQDYVSVDLYDPSADFKLDVAGELPFDNETIDNIYACHVIEHLSRDEWANAVNEWVRVLKVGGTIEIRTPDIVKVCEQVMNEPDSLWSIQVLYGLQTTPGEYHKNGFTEKSLTKDFIGLEAELLEPSTDYELHIKFTKEAL